MIFHYDLYLGRKGASGALSPDGQGNTGAAKCGFKANTQAELIFNLVLFHILKIKSSLSRLFELEAFFAAECSGFPSW